MTTTTRCPDRDTLQRLLLGQLPADVAEPLASHLDQCSICTAAAAGLRGTDTLTDAVRSTLSGPDAPAPSASELIERLARQTPPVERPRRDALLDFLAPPQADDEIGRLDGYRILKKLGEGGMGMVLEAEDIRLKRRVAMKVMKPEVAANEAHRVRFLREAQAAAAVEHDHICPIYQVGEDNGVPFIAMPFLKGEPLDARLRRERPLPVTEVIRIGCEIAEGLAAAHAHGLIHRDIKPGNIWLEADTGRVKILDFGLARSTNDNVQLTQSGAIVGTPAYMAPEQARAQAVDHRADIFSLGCVMYEMATGRRPFIGENTMAMLTSLAVDTPAAVATLNPAIPAELAALIEQLLSKKPDRRPASATAVVDSLRRMLPQGTIVMAPAAPNPWADIDLDTPTETAPAPKALAPVPSTPPPRRGVWVALALLLFGGIAFGMYQLVFKTENGTLIVEVAKDAEVRFKNGKLQIYDETGKTLKYELEASEKNKTLPPGKYLVKVTGADGVKLETPEFKMDRGGKPIVRVIAVSRDPKGSASPDADRRIAEWVLAKGGAVMFGDDQPDGRNITRLEELPTKDSKLHYIGFDQKSKPISDADLDQLTGAKHLQSLFLNYQPITDAGLRRLASMENLRGLVSLELVATRVTPAGLSELSKFPKLAGLRIDVPQLGDLGLAEVGKLKSLTYLSAGDSGITDAGLAHLKDLKINNLALYGNPEITDAGMDHVAKLATLNVLVIEHTRVGDAGLAKLRDLKEMLSVNLGRTQVTDDGLAIVGEWRRLQVGLILTQTAITDKGLSHLKNLSELRQLDLSETKITDAGLPHLQNLKALQTLDVRKTKVTPAGIQALAAALPQCRIEYDGGVIEPKAPADPDRKAAEYVISVGGMVHVNDQDRYIKAVAELPKDPFRLTCVLLENKQVTDAGLAVFKDCKNLTQIHVSNTAMSDVGLANFKGCTNLNLITLSGTKITDAGLAHLNGFNKLTALTLNITQVTDAGLAQLKDCKVLRNLHVSGTIVSDAGLAHFSDCKDMTVLGLNDTRVSDASLVHLKEYKSLRQVFFSGTRVSDAGMAHIKECKNLWILDLSNTPISDTGLAHLKDCKNLTSLIVRTTKVTAKGLADFHAALPQCRIEYDGGIIEPKATERR
jgi:serine/threonine protein kinase/Leucine-rich repeat (LRR) protein